MVCTTAQKTRISQEIRYAVGMANAAKADFSKYGYEALFFDKDTIEKASWKADYTETLGRITKMLDGTSTSTGEYDFTVLCDTGTTPKTKGCEKRFPAFVNQQSKTQGTLTFCEVFFDPSKTAENEAKILKTSDRLETCKNGNLNLREAQRSGASVLIHECIHTSYAMRGADP